MEPGLVYMTDEELERIAHHLELTAAKFRAKYRVTREDDSDEWFIDAQDGRGCPLLSKDRRCMVHPVKPVQCATFPFWPEMLDDVKVWDSAKTFCPGLDAPEGELYTKARITAIRAGWIGT
jgi:Fe-S-cluster containining protein